VFEPPYEHLVPCSPERIRQMVDVSQWRGRALVWQLVDQHRQRGEYELLRHKAPGLPLMVLLPSPTEIDRIVPMMPAVRHLSPRMILPHGLIDSPYRLRQVLTVPPRGIAASLTHYLIRRGLLREKKAIREFQRIVELSSEIRSVAALSRRMYTSRRTLGRHFTATRMPVPSHCLHFARILQVAIQLQNDDSAIFRIAGRFGYPDGFTMSNQMKRLIGYRPSEVRELLGWEWVVEAWLKKEGCAPR
jgi:AraC-like DNA-binding protein